MSPSRTGCAARGFNKEKAVAAAMHAFWGRGFEGVSIDDLTVAMGVSRPTLYAVFGSKEALFRRALEHYQHEEAVFYHQAGKAPTAKGVAEALLRGALELFSGSGGSTPPGCLYVAHLVACGSEADAIRADMFAHARTGEAALIRRFERAALDGDLPPNVDPVGLAYMLIGLVQGVAVLASSGAPRSAIERMVNTALAAWPVAEPARDIVASSSSAT